MIAESSGVRLSRFPLQLFLPFPTIESSSLIVTIAHRYTIYNPATGDISCRFLIAEYLYRQAIPICGNSPLETFSHGHGFRRPPFHNIISFHSWLSYPKIFLGQIEYPPIAKSENEGISLMMNGPPLPFLANHESTWAKPRWTFIHSFSRFSPCGATSSNLFPKNICRKHSALRRFIALYSNGTVKVNNGANLKGAAVENTICKPIVFLGKTRGAFIKFLSCQSRGDWEKE
jgi:hypothetical protein